MATIIQPVRKQFVPESPATISARPAVSNRATAEMTEIAQFQQEASASNLTHHQAQVGQRTLVNRLANPRERKLAGSASPEAASKGKEGNAVDGGNVSSADTLFESDAVPTRQQVREEEMDRFDQFMQGSGRGQSKEDLDELKKKHADSVDGALDIADLLHPQPETGRRELSDLTIMMTGAEYGKGAKTIDASGLLAHVETKHSARDIDAALADLQKVVGANARLRLPDGPGPESHRSFSLCAAFHQMVSSRAIASDMCSRISGLGVQPRATTAEAGRLLLKSASLDDRTAAPMLAKIVDLTVLSSTGKASVCKVVRAAVANLPTTLWPVEGLPQRQSLLNKFDEMSMSEGPAPHPFMSAFPKREQQQRARIMSKPVPGKPGQTVSRNPLGSDEESDDQEFSLVRRQP